MSGFDLTGLVRAVVDGSSLRGPREIAAKTVENVPADKLRAALAEALVPFAREYLTRARRPVSPAPMNVNSARSSKVAAIRGEGWRRTLVGQFHIGQNRWKVLVECTYEDVMFLAAERREQAVRNAAMAAVFDALAEAMRAREAVQVGELPEDVLAGILSGEAVAA